MNPLLCPCRERTPHSKDDTTTTRLRPSSQHGTLFEKNAPPPPPAIRYCTQQNRIWFRLSILSPRRSPLCRVCYPTTQSAHTGMTPMSSKEALNALKRKSMEEPEVVASSNNNNDKESKSKARRVSTDTSVPSVVSTATASTTASPSLAAAAAVAANVIVSTPIAAAPKSLMEIIGALIQDLDHSDNVRVNAALDVLSLDFMKDKQKRESLVTAGGCLALVHLARNCLDKAIDIIPSCDQVTELWELNELAELATLHKTLNVIIILTFQHDESRVGIAAIGGVEAVVKAMNTFPKCHALQERACGALRNLACCDIGKQKVAEKGGIEVLLAAVNNHLGSAMLCQKGCWALYNIANGSKQNTELLISFGGGAAVAKVRTKWSDNDDVLFHVRRLTSLIASEMKTWADED